LARRLRDLFKNKKLEELSNQVNILAEENKQLKTNFDEVNKKLEDITNAFKIYQETYKKLDEYLAVLKKAKDTQDKYTQAYSKYVNLS
jgi:predicted nuclease with TOPRIM domain